MPYAILRIEKRQDNSARGIEVHHEREEKFYASNPDINSNHTKENYHIVKPTDNYRKEINTRIENAQCRVRKNSVKFVDVISTASAEFFKDKKTEKEYFKKAYDFMCSSVGEENIFSAVVHVDERTPHMHLCFTPITKDKRLSAKEIIGDRQNLSRWQDNFYNYMSGFFPTLERGKSVMETKRKHIPTQLFKQVTLLSSQLAQIETTLQDIKWTNSSKKRDEALELLKNWYPQASVFISEINAIKADIEQ